jgi:fructose-1,6-bisphosphatase
MNIFAASQNTSLTISGRVLPRVHMSISENTDTRSINSITGTENLQVFAMNNSSNVGAGYQVVVESQNAVINQTESPFFTDQNDEMINFGYAIYFNNQVLNFSSGQAVAKSTANQTNGNFQSNLEITKISQNSNTAEGPYKDTIMVRIIAN